MTPYEKERRRRARLTLYEIHWEDGQKSLVMAKSRAAAKKTVIDFSCEALKERCAALRYRKATSIKVLARKTSGSRQEGWRPKPIKQRAYGSRKRGYSKKA